MTAGGRPGMWRQRRARTGTPWPCWKDNWAETAVALVVVGERPVAPLSRSTSSTPWPSPSPSWATWSMGGRARVPRPGCTRARWSPGCGRAGRACPGGRGRWLTRRRRRAPRPLRPTRPPPQPCVSMPPCPPPRSGMRWPRRARRAARRKRPAWHAPWRGGRSRMRRRACWTPARRPAWAAGAHF